MTVLIEYILKDSEIPDLWLEAIYDFDYDIKLLKKELDTELYWFISMNGNDVSLLMPEQILLMFKLLE